jgi:hypothetical protein
MRKWSPWSRGIKTPRAPTSAVLSELEVTMPSDKKSIASAIE